MYTITLGVQQYGFNPLPFLRVVQDKYISLYRELITQLKSYMSAIRILAKGYLPTTLIPPSKLQYILAEVKRSLQQTNPDYAFIFERLHLYYNMPLVTFGVDRNMNLVIQFPVFIQPIHSEIIGSLPVRDCSSPDIGHQYGSQFIHPPMCEQTLYSLE